MAIKRQKTDDEMVYDAVRLLDVVAYRLLGKGKKRRANTAFRLRDEIILFHSKLIMDEEKNDVR